MSDHALSFIGSACQHASLTGGQATRVGDTAVQLPLRSQGTLPPDESRPPSSPPALNPNELQRAPQIVSDVNELRRCGYRQVVVFISVWPCINFKCKVSYVHRNTGAVSTL